MSTPVSPPVRPGRPGPGLARRVSWLAAVLALQCSAASAAPAAGKPAPAAPSDAGTLPRNAAARSRMLECGHQWSNMKRAGTATGTWKDFSRNCLAQR